MLRRAKERLGTTILGTWTLTGVLGSGGVATVYRARHADGRVVALKLLHAEIADDVDIVKRVTYEARAANRLNHPGAVRIQECDVTDEGLPFLVMDLLTGCTLSERLERDTPLPLDELLRIADEVLDVLVAAHAAGIIHRDVKPANIFLTAEGPVKLLDFGIAKATADQRSLQTAPGSTLGTLGFMAPEQLNGRAAAFSDVFSVGATMFRALAGRAVHRGRDLVETLKLVASTSAPLLDTIAPTVPEQVCAVVDHALAFDPNDRYLDARTMQADVRALLRGEVPSIAMARRSEDGPTRQVVISEDRTSERSAAERLVGGVVGGSFRLKRLLGRGGMGAVYESATSDGTPCAVKVIFVLGDGEGTLVEDRFRREAALAARIRHVNVVSTLVADVDKHAGHPYFVMELLDGRDLASWLRELGALEASVAVRIFVQACRGVAAAHALGIIHRDLKPANIMLARSEGTLIAKICDFGLAKNTLTDSTEHGLSLTKSSGALLGTPQYTAPEQAMQAKDADTRADVWGLAISLYEALSGTRPWARCETLAQLLLAICTESVPPLAQVAPWVDPALAELVERGLLRDRELRWPTVAAFAEALEPFMGGTDTLVPGDLVGASTSERRSDVPNVSQSHRMPGRDGAGSQSGIRSPSGGASLAALTAPSLASSRSQAASVVRIGAAAAFVAIGMAAAWFVLRPKGASEVSASATAPVLATPTAGAHAPEAPSSSSPALAAPAPSSSAAQVPPHAAGKSLATLSPTVKPQLRPTAPDSAKPAATAAPKAGGSGIQFKPTW